MKFRGLWAPDGPGPTRACWSLLSHSPVQTLQAVWGLPGCLCSVPTHITVSPKKGRQDDFLTGVSPWSVVSRCYTVRVGVPSLCPKRTSTISHTGSHWSRGDGNSRATPQGLRVPRGKGRVTMAHCSSEVQLCANENRPEPPPPGAARIACVLS